jgi:hypothetical protein
MKNTITLLVLLITLISCNTTRQVQMQRGTYEVKNNKIYFQPVESWHKFDITSAPDTIFRMRNTAVRKDKIILTY